jgi:hypothetical protein
MIDIMENKVLGPAIRQGIEQGMIEGIKRGKTEVLSRQLAKKFGSLPDPIVTRLHRASEGELLGSIACSPPVASTKFSANTPSPVSLLR